MGKVEMEALIVCSSNGICTLPSIQVDTQMAYSSCPIIIHEPPFEKELESQQKYLEDAHEFHNALIFPDLFGLLLVKE